MYTPTPSEFVMLIKSSPEYTKMFNQVRACDLRFMVGTFGETTVNTMVLAGRLMLTFSRNDKQITLVTAYNDKSRLGLHSCDMAPDELKDVIVDILGEAVELRPNEDMRPGDQIRMWGG